MKRRDLPAIVTGVIGGVFIGLGITQGVWQLVPVGLVVTVSPAIVRWLLGGFR